MEGDAVRRNGIFPESYREQVVIFNPKGYNYYDPWEAVDKTMDSYDTKEINFNDTKPRYVIIKPRTPEAEAMFHNLQTKHDGTEWWYQNGLFLSTVPLTFKLEGGNWGSTNPPMYASVVPEQFNAHHLAPTPFLVCLPNSTYQIYLTLIDKSGAWAIQEAIEPNRIQFSVQSFDGELDPETLSNLTATSVQVLGITPVTVTNHAEIHSDAAMRGTDFNRVYSAAPTYVPLDVTELAVYDQQDDTTPNLQVLRTLPTITSEHVAIHLGGVFHYCATNAALAAGGTLLFEIKNKNFFYKDVILSGLHVFINGGYAEVEIIEAPTITDGSTEITGMNHYRDKMSSAGGGTTPVVGACYVYSNPTSISGGALIENYYTSIQGPASRESEWVLHTESKKYLIRVTNRSASAQAISCCFDLTNAMV